MRTASPKLHWFDRTAADLVLGIAVAAGTAFGIAAIWLRPGQAWLNPELLRIGEIIGKLPTLLAKFALFFDWQWFDTNPHRARQVSDLLEITDAIARPYIANVIVHPVLSVTTCLFVVLALTFAYRLFRLNDFSRGEALLFCTLVAATPGFLSNLFLYFRPAKPVSFILLVALLWFVFRYAADPKQARLPMLFLLLAGGLFTDELLLWALVFVVVAVCLLGAYRQALPVGAVALAVVATWALAVFAILPMVYATFGPGGARTVSFSDVSTGDPIAWRMLSYLYWGRLYEEGVKIAARTIAACLGRYENSVGTRAFGFCVMIAVLAALIVFFRKRDKPAWKLAAVGLFGLLLFSIFGMWLHWYHQPGALNDHVALNYYYNSPVSIFVVLLAGAAFKSLQAWAGSPQRAWITTIAAAVVIVGVVASNVTRFMQLNDIQRMFQVGPTDVEAIFRSMNRSRSGDEPPSVIATGGADRLETTVARYNALGQRLFGEDWKWSSPHRDPSVFEHNMPYLGGSYAHFGLEYGRGLCALYFVDRPCPVTFRETLEAPSD